MALFDPQNSTPITPTNSPVPGNTPPPPPPPNVLRATSNVPTIPAPPRPVLPVTVAPPPSFVPTTNNQKPMTGNPVPPPRPVQTIPTIPPVSSIPTPPPSVVQPTTRNQQPITSIPPRPTPPIAPPPLAPRIVPSLASMPPLSRPTTPEPEDIFSGSSKTPTSYSKSPETTASIAESPARGFGRKLVRLLFLALGAAVIVAAGYFGYHYFLAATAKPATVNDNANVNTDINKPAVGNNMNINQPPALNTNANTNANVNASTPPLENIPTNAPVNANQPAVFLPPQDDPNSTIDSDHDGLTDYQEVHVYHTDMLRSDTDGDGLSDGEEVNIYHTDPLKADTDGDGYSDGAEVKSGYNPLGPGKLPPPPAIK